MKYYVKKWGSRATLWEDVLWYPTDLAPATIFEIREEAEKAILNSKKKWPKERFELEEIEEFETLEEVKPNDDEREGNPQGV